MEISVRCNIFRRTMYMYMYTGMSLVMGVLCSALHSVCLVMNDQTAMVCALLMTCDAPFCNYRAATQRRFINNECETVVTAFL